MNLIISSEADTASINLRDRLLEKAEWKVDGEFEGHKIWFLLKDYGSFCLRGTRLITIDKLHINAEGIDNKWFRKTGIKIENIVFLSRHKALWLMILDFVFFIGASENSSPRKFRNR